MSFAAPRHGCSQSPERNRYLNGRSADTNAVVPLGLQPWSIPSAAKYRHRLEIESAVAALFGAVIAAYVLLEPSLPVGD